MPEGRDRRVGEDWYELLVLAARYLFTLLGVIVVWRSFGWLRRESRRRRRALREMPDAGFIGELYVLSGEGKSFRTGDSFPVPMEGVLGSRKGCDIRVPHGSVASRHALFDFHEDGLHLRAHRGAPVRVDDQPLPAGYQAILRHGASLAVGAVELQLRLFAGLDLDAEAEAEPEDEEAEEDDEIFEAEEETAPFEEDFSHHECPPHDDLQRTDALTRRRRR